MPGPVRPVPVRRCLSRSAVLLSGLLVLPLAPTAASAAASVSAGSVSAGSVSAGSVSAASVSASSAAGSAGPGASARRSGARAASVRAAARSRTLLAARLSARRTDDYPYRGAQPGTSDRWGFTARQCVSFVAWRLAQRGAALDNRSQGWGDASNWDDTARRRGYRVTTRPVPGAVAQWNAWERTAYYGPGSSRPVGLMVAGSAGHVAFVRRVFADGSVEVEHYNALGDRRYAVSRVRAPRYLRLS